MHRAGPRRIEARAGESLLKKHSGVPRVEPFNDLGEERVRAFLAVSALAFLLAAAAHAGDTSPHRLSVHLAEGAAWEMTVSSRISDANPVLGPGQVVRTYAYRLKTKDAGFVITRTEMSRQDDRKPNPGMPDVSDLPNPSLIALKEIVFAADASLTPQIVVNLAEILHKNHATETATFGKDMADQMDQQQMSSESIVTSELSLDTLTARLRQSDFVVGVPRTEPDTLPGIGSPGDIPAQTTITLTQWDEASRSATFTLLKEIALGAKTAALKTFFEGFLYPVNTTDADQAAELQKKAGDLAAASDLADAMTCQFTADITTGLVTRGHCTTEMTLKSTLITLSSQNAVDMSQTLKR